MSITKPTLTDNRLKRLNILTVILVTLGVIAFILLNWWTAGDKYPHEPPISALIKIYSIALIPTALPLIIGYGLLKRKKLARFAAIITGAIAILLLLPISILSIDSRYNLLNALDGMTNRNPSYCDLQARKSPVGYVDCPMVVEKVNYPHASLTILSPIYIPVLIYLLILLNRRDVKVAFGIGANRTKIEKNDSPADAIGDNGGANTDSEDRALLEDMERAIKQDSEHRAKPAKGEDTSPPSLEAKTDSSEGHSTTS